MLKSKTIHGCDPDHLDQKFNEWAEDQKDIRVVSVNFIRTDFGHLQLNILYMTMVSGDDRMTQEDPIGNRYNWQWELGVRARRALRKMGVKSLAELPSISIHSFEKLKGCGPATVQEINNLLKDSGISPIGSQSN